MCDLYLGPTRATTPPNPFWTNPSIQSSTYTFTRNPLTPYPINVELQNHDSTTSGCASALVNLYWSDPTTSFLILSAHQIPSTLAAPFEMPIALAQSLPPQDASALFPYAWSPDGTVVGGDPSNSGHVCLAAIGQCLSMDCNAPAPTNVGNPANTASPLVAIHNVQVNDPPPGPHPRRIWPFFFGATNGANVAGRTRLTARAYNPRDEGHRGALWHLAGLPQVRAALGRTLKFAVPAEVHVALGAESVLVPHDVPVGAATPRLSYTGAVQPEYADHLVKRDWVKVGGEHEAVKEVDLLPRQVQAAAVYVVPHDEEGHVYAVEVRHELLTHAAPVVLGGLTVLFVAPRRPF